MAKPRRAEKSTADILQNKVESGAFDVFLCHSNRDKPQVKQIGRDLKEMGILPWLDEWELRPGLPWQDALEEQIEAVKSAAVFVGSDGVGPWQNQEIKAFLRKFVDQKAPVIPVLLPSAPAELPLPIFLLGMTWVDFRLADPDPMRQLVWGITGERSYSALQSPRSRKKDEQPDREPASSSKPPGRPAKKAGRPKPSREQTRGEGDTAFPPGRDGASEPLPGDPSTPVPRDEPEAAPPSKPEAPVAYQPAPDATSLQEVLVGTWRVQILNPFGMVGEMILELAPANAFRGQLQTPMGIQLVQGQWQLNDTQLLLQGTQALGPQVMPYVTLIQLQAMGPEQLTMRGMTSAGEHTTWQKLP